MKQSTLAASDFKARCLRILDEVAEQGVSVIITKRGRPIARLIPIVSRDKPLKGSWKGIVKIKGDIVHFNVADEWEAAR